MRIHADPDPQPCFQGIQQSVGSFKTNKTLIPYFDSTGSRTSINLSHYLMMSKTVLSPMPTTLGSCGLLESVSEFSASVSTPSFRTEYYFRITSGAAQLPVRCNADPEPGFESIRIRILKLTIGKKERKKLLQKITGTLKILNTLFFFNDFSQ